MIIQLRGPAENVAAGRRGLEALAESWGEEIAEAPAEATASGGTVGYQWKGSDPASWAAVVLSIPSAALAVADLADRIRKRRRAKELIDQAQQLADQQVTVRLVSRSRTVEVRTLDPDRLLDLLADDDQAD